MNKNCQPQSEIRNPEEDATIPVVSTPDTTSALSETKTLDEVSPAMLVASQVPAINTLDDGVQDCLDTTIVQKLPVISPLPVTRHLWFGMDEAVVGLAHRAKNLPCQDAAIAHATLRPFVVLADGAGSAIVSDIGAQAVVLGLARLIQTLEFQWSPLLDAAESGDKESLSKWPMLLVKHARGILDDTAKTHRREVRDLRCTLLCALVGAERFLWFKVGDGEMLVERTHWDETGEPVRQYQVLGERGKGDFANQTTFIDIAKPEDVQWGIESIHEISGLAAMSDGGAERLVAADGSKVAARVGNMLDDLRNQKLKRQDLTKLFYSPDFCDRSSGDDRSMALLARDILPRPKSSVPPIEIAQPSVHNEVVQEAVVTAVPMTGTLRLKKNMLRRGKTGR